MTKILAAAVVVLSVTTFVLGWKIFASSTDAADVGVSVVTERETSPAPNAESAPETCEVNDPDLKGVYSGSCKDGLADGYGVAKGKDTYEGQFLAGNAHGQGTYRWGDTTEWAGQTYTAGKRNGDRHGFGMAAVSVDTRLPEINGSETWVSQKVR